MQQREQKCAERARATASRHIILVYFTNTADARARASHSFAATPVLPYVRDLNNAYHFHFVAPKPRP